MSSKIRKTNYWVNALVVLTVVPMFFSNCKEDPYIYVCKDGIVEYKLLAPLEKPNHGLQNLDMPPSIQGWSTNIIIKNEDEYRTYVRSNAVLPKINFSKEVLLAGMSYSTTQTHVVSQEVINKCSTDEIFFTINQKFGNIPSAGVTNYFAIIPKIPESTKVRFVINYV